MPELITTSDFMKETWEDFKSPTTSNFVHRMNPCKNTVNSFEEILDYDRSGLTKMKKSAKALHSSGNLHVNHEVYLSENLEKLGNSVLQREDEGEMGAAFIKFAVVTKELASLMKNLMLNLNNIVTFPLDSLLKGDLKGVKGDLKKPFDKSSKDYDVKFNKIEKEKKQLAKEAGMLKTEVTGPEVAEELEKERRSFQLQTCEYFIKVNEIRMKKGVELLQHLVDFYQAQAQYFQDGLKTIEHYKYYVEDLISNLTHIKRKQDSEKQKLTELRDVLKESIASYKEAYSRPLSSSSIMSGYSLHQLQGNKAHGCEMSGYLLKKSEGVRKVWQRRRCVIRDGQLSISHADTTKDPVRLNLLTCQVKLIGDDQNRRCFDLISSSKNRTYHFQTEDAASMEEWISVLNNCKEAILLKAFGESDSSESNAVNQRLSELTRTVITEVRRLPGNNCCCDCGANDPEWLSVNLGVLICLECCGVHRLMGVHISRTQSIVIDRLGTSQLLLARAMSNKAFNDVMEATLEIEAKPHPDSNMDERKAFILGKYEKRKFVIPTCSTDEDRKIDLRQAIVTHDLQGMLQVYAEGCNFMEPLPEQEDNGTALHLAIEQEDGSSLPIVDFIIQNSNGKHLHNSTYSGETVLHTCARLNQTECMKLLLRLAPDLVNDESLNGKTALELAKDKGYQICVDLLTHAISGKSELFEHINIDWDLIQDEHLYDTIDYSDDDLDCLQTPDKKARTHASIRPSSAMLSMSGDSLTSTHHRDRPASIATSLDSSFNHRNPNDTFTIPHVPKMKGGSSSQVPSFATLRKKAPAPAPPNTHIRNSSDSYTPHQRHQSDLYNDPYTSPRGQGHARSPSDPPISSFKPHNHNQNSSGGSLRGSQVPGGKLVLPPPPTFSDEPFKPNPAPRPNKIATPIETEMMRIFDSMGINGQSHSNDSLDSVDSSTNSAKMSGPPIPTPRQKRRSRRPKRVRALYDCEADNEDELSFVEGDVIVVIQEDEEEWWEGHIEGRPERKGLFPVTFVEVMSE